MERRKSRFALIGCAAILAATVVGILLAATAARAATPKYTKKMRILFIGNSYTNTNDLPRLLTGLLAVKAIDLETRRVTPGGCTLEKHWKGDAARKAISEGPWDYVVIQEQSQMPVFNPPVTLKYAALLADMVRKTGAEPVFYMTWARKNKPAMQEGLTRTYMKAGLASKAMVAPVGIAWQEALKKNPKLALHAKDGSHPTQKGTYLAACTIFATILRRDPTGLPGKVVVGEKTPRGTFRYVPCNLRTREVKPLQAIAWKTVQRLRSYAPVTADPTTKPAKAHKPAKDAKADKPHKDK